MISANTILMLEPRNEKKNVLNMSQTRAGKGKVEHTINDKFAEASKRQDFDYIDDLAKQTETAAGLEYLKDLFLIN